MSVRTKIIGCIASGYMLFSTPLYAASLDEMVESMYSSFTTTTTRQNSFKTANGRQVFTGGAYSMRFRPKEVNVVNFRPPSIGASCNGIDFFAGSLDIMSKDELVQVGRNIAAAATVYAFRLALNSVCSSCNSIMTNIQTMVQQFNRLAKMSCNDALTAMENMSDLDEKASQNSMNNWMKTKVQATTNDWAEDMTKIPDNWFAEMTENALTIDDIATDDPASLKNFTDLGFLIAYNTDLAKSIFTWMGEDDARSALWSVLSNPNKDCPSAADNSDKGKLCGIPADHNHQIVDFFIGDIGNASVASEKQGSYKLKLPECNSTKTVQTLDGVTYIICEYPDSQLTDNVGTLSEVSPMGPIYFKDAFGTSAVDDDNPLDVKMPEVCDSATNRVISVNSLFSKLVTINDDSLTDRQAYIASIIGSTYTRDLYRLNKDGGYAANAEELADCGAKASIMSARLRELIATSVAGVNSGINTGVKLLKSDPRWKDGKGVESIIAKLCTLQINSSQISEILGPNNSFKIQPAAYCSSQGS